MKKAPRDTLTNKQLRKMGKKAFVTSFHLPDRNHDIGTHKRCLKENFVWVESLFGTSV